MKIIFNQKLTDEKHNKMVEELNKNPDFKINFNNFHEFFDCNYELDVLKEKNVDYELLLEDTTQAGKKTYDYSIFGKILIPDSSYEGLKEYFRYAEDYTENNNEEKTTSNNFQENSEPIQNYEKHPLLSILPFIFLLFLLILFLLK